MQGSALVESFNIEIYNEGVLHCIEYFGANGFSLTSVSRVVATSTGVIVGINMKELDDLLIHHGALAFQLLVLVRVHACPC